MVGISTTYKTRVALEVIVRERLGIDIGQLMDRRKGGLEMYPDSELA
jgi:hypothetical protein